MNKIVFLYVGGVALILSAVFNSVVMMWISVAVIYFSSIFFLVDLHKKLKSNTVKNFDPEIFKWMGFLGFSLGTFFAVWGLYQIPYGGVANTIIGIIAMLGFSMLYLVGDNSNKNNVEEREMQMENNSVTIEDLVFHMVDVDGNKNGYYAWGKHPTDDFVKMVEEQYHVNIDAENVGVVEEVNETESGLVGQYYTYWIPSKE